MCNGPAISGPASPIACCSFRLSWFLSILKGHDDYPARDPCAGIVQVFVAIGGGPNRHGRSETWLADDVDRMSYWTKKRAARSSNEHCDIPAPQEALRCTALTRAKRQIHPS